jgi:tRNA uridine 5-carbamoylmethylation protein Kti12
MPNFIMMVGLPGCGKSTLVKKMNTNLDHVLVSTDNTIEQYATSCSKTYNEVFQQTIGFAQDKAARDLKDAFAADKDIILDQTNLSRKSRHGKLAQVPKHYTKTCVFVSCHPLVHRQRLASRPGKVIPEKVMEDMKNRFEEPTISEGFDKVKIIET